MNDEDWFPSWLSRVGEGVRGGSTSALFAALEEVKGRPGGEQLAATVMYMHDMFRDQSNEARVAKAIYERYLAMGTTHLHVGRDLNADGNAVVGVDLSTAKKASGA